MPLPWMTCDNASRPGKSAAAADRRTRAPECSRAWHHQPRHGTAPAEPGLCDAELAPAGEHVVPHHAGHASPTGRPHQEAADARIDGEQRQSSPAPVADGGEHEASGHEATRCRPKSLGRRSTHELALSARRQARGLKAAARTLPAEPRPAGNDETWARLVTTFPSEDHTAVAAAVAATALASATEVEDGSAPPWRPEGNHASQVL